MGPLFTVIQGVRCFPGTSVITKLKLWLLYLWFACKGKGNVYPRTGRKDAEGALDRGR